MKENNWFDPFYIQSHLNEEESNIQKNVRDFCNNELKPTVVERNRKNEFDKELYPKFGSLGVLGQTVKTHGGSGTSNLAYGLVAYEFEKIDSSYRSSISVQSSLVIHPINEFGSQEQKDKYLPQLIKGEKIGCFGLTESEAGSDPASMKTTFKVTKDGYILNGGDDFPLACADVNFDGSVNVLDIVAVVGQILNGRSADANSAKLIQKSDMLTIEADGFIGAVQMTLAHGNDFTINLTDKAMVADYSTKGNQTTLIIVAPQAEELFVSNDSYTIIDLVVANSIDQIDVLSPESFKLGEAFPNPFNPSTSFNLSVPEPGNVSILVYNVMGQVVAKLADGYFDTNNYSFTWDASSVPSGVYLVKASSVNSISTQKVMLLK